MLVAWIGLPALVVPFWTVGVLVALIGVLDVIFGLRALASAGRGPSTPTFRPSWLWTRGALVGFAGSAVWLIVTAVVARGHAATPQRVEPRTPDVEMEVVDQDPWQVSHRVCEDLGQRMCRPEEVGDAARRAVPSHVTSRFLLTCFPKVHGIDRLMSAEDDWHPMYDSLEYLSWEWQPREYSFPRAIPAAEFFRGYILKIHCCPGVGGQ